MGYSFKYTQNYIV